MKQNLIVAYSDGREDVYPITEGQFTLGSDAKCEFGIQAPGVEPRHIVFSTGGDAVYVVNLCDSETASLNGIPLDGRHLFEVGDELSVGTVSIRLRQAAKEGEDLSASAAGVTEVVKSVRRDLRSGWRGYRKALEKIAPFISPGEAQTAELLHSTGVRALLHWVLAVVALNAIAWIFQSRHWFVLEEVATCASSYISLIAILALSARYRIRFAGRAFSCIELLTFGGFPPGETWTSYFSTIGWLAVVLFPVSYLWGWFYDIGAGCVFAKRCREFVWRYFLLMISVGALCGLSVWSCEHAPSVPGAAYRYWPILGVAATYPVWFRFVRCHLDESQLDVLFVLTLASFRDARRWIARTLTILAVATPLLLVLGSLGARERLVWDESDESLVVTDPGRGDKLAWYWAGRGRYMVKSDFETSLIYQIPYEVLLANAGKDVDRSSSCPVAGPGESESGLEYNELDEKCKEVETDVWGRSIDFRINDFRIRMLDQHGIDLTNEDAVASFYDSADWKNAVADFEQQKDVVLLSSKGKELCQKIAAIQLDATNAVAFAELKEALSPYRTMVLDDVSSAQAIFLEEVKNRESYGSRNSKLYHAQIGIGILSRTLQAANYMSAAISSIIVPCLVFLALGAILLWKRGSDSAVGFWLGIAMTSSVVDAFLANDYLQVESSMNYHLWHWAVESPWGGLVASLLGIAFSSGRLIMVIGYMAQSVLFVLLCWPRKPNVQGGRWKRSLAFIGKAVTGFIVAFSAACAAGLIMEGATGCSSLVICMMVGFLAIALLGWWLRRKRRFYTEAPELGWEFFVGWLLLKLSVLIAVSAGSGEDPLFGLEAWLAPLQWIGGRTCLAGVVSGIAAVAGGVLFFRLFIRRNFLSVLTVKGFAFTLFALVVPLISAVCNPLVAELLRGSFLQSRQGEKIVSVAIVVLVMRPIWNYLSRLSRMLSGRNMVKVESRVEATLENILEKPGEIDVRDEVFDGLGDLGLKEYALYVRTKAGSFDLALKNRWSQLTADTFQMSEYLRHYLGFNPHVVELDQLAHNESLFFQSFELCRIKERLHAACLLPICLGKSVRAILVTPSESDGRPVLASEVILDNVNALGLAAIVSLNERALDGNASVDNE